MIRKVLLIALSAVLALVLLPTADASASVTKGRKVGCYGIKKAGRYGYVRVAIEGQVSPGYLNGYGNISISSECPRTNAIPVVKLSIYHLQVRTVHNTVLTQTAHGGSTTGSIISEKTPNRVTACGSAVRVWIEVGYNYYDGSYVRPFWIAGPAFVRC